MKDVLIAFDSFLADRVLSLDTVVIGGAALILLGVIDRATRDVDCLEPALEDEIREAARSFAVDSGGELAADWLNNGPIALADELPAGWRNRTEVVLEGRAITVRVLARSDLLCTKLYAFCDRQEDLDDCIALAPSPDEIATAAPWVAERDAHPDWPEHVRRSLTALAKELGHDLQLG